MKDIRPKVFSCVHCCYFFLPLAPVFALLLCIIYGIKLFKSLKNFTIMASQVFSIHVRYIGKNLLQ